MKACGSSTSTCACSTRTPIATSRCCIVTDARTVRLAVVQMAMAEEPSVNDECAERLIREAAAAGAELVVLPELFRFWYFCQREDYAKFDLAEPVPGPSTERFAALARELGVALVLSLFEERAAGLYHNTAAVLDADGRYVGKYRKMHIPDDPRYYEKFYFTPGDLGFRVFDVAGLRLGVLVCWDQWYPEAARLTALMGADVLVYPTAIGWHPEERDEAGAAQREAWETIQRSHAIANGCYVAAANRFGFEPEPGGPGGLEFWGSSFLFGPDGVPLARAGSDGEAVLLVDVDRARMRRQRQGWPFLRDRRIDAYGALDRRFID
ncbi:MAG: carbon-nitrogen hydrolase [Pseudomonadales bacterium]|nr:carbon-nitrogen hydrolase [Pseudomonadales bacterium]